MLPEGCPLIERREELDLARPGGVLLRVDDAGDGCERLVRGDSRAARAVAHASRGHGERGRLNGPDLVGSRLTR